MENLELIDYKKDDLSEILYNLKSYTENKKAVILTYGCQMNFHDSEKISWLLEQMDFKIIEDINEADLIILNTCSIRKSAEDKVYGKLGELKHLKKLKNSLKVCVCGCMMQRQESRDIVKEKFENVDIIFGTNNIYKFPQLLLKVYKDNEKVIDIEENYTNDDNNLGANRLYNFKSFVNIMYGCNNFCTYCIVPYTRGREKSRRPKEILNEIRDLAAHGTKEVTLLGQNVNSYGKNLDEKYTFTDLLKMINEVDGIERIRFMTSHPKDFSDELIYAFRDLDKLSNFLHLPVQAGSSKILKLMNRHYTKEQYLEKIYKIKEIVPDIALSTDIMVGFPGETEEDFLETIDLCKKVEYDSSFTFIYSMREGTIAANKEQIDEAIKHQRFNRLLDLLYPIQLRKNKAEIGKVKKVLVEDVSKTNKEALSGRTEEFKLVNFKGSGDLIGKIIPLKITDANTFSLTGEII
ncbi:tRNA-2-methylthio-N6-dimethylallyladenosine synthase [Peptoniphilus koenoeneniae]|uniref:tRNA-2-methylthio-N(6)-dimethylallyladenosine synthase n=1 Tax=Peptoniphilus koenoeneniae TaxID=507751 RepID=A0ABU0ASJ6_9FIRM|nr:MULTISPECIES: tRNA (N6-isopentenyl adenosine(37)-C2)-methylthiotransferase MiaB [Peptoniphilus]ERT56877.1 tRNA-i(6)A37 thiotransferase enzyme MiaB [Peptoniphilus sp. BV3C26]MDQ0274242.1 tRNA-2-methylthio-N6-dimethylallyladenosine synthase [Peptoniphilus koenoeneniae]